MNFIEMWEAMGPIVASMMTTPCTRADCAIGG